MVDKWILRQKKLQQATRQTRNTRYFLLFVDWKSAFDRVDHDLLLKRLEDIQASEECRRVVHILLWSSNFSVDGLKIHPIKRGCPQGSMLSPLLFVLYFGTLLAELRAEIGEENIGAFADDLLVIAQGEDQLHRLAKLIGDWATRNRCELNVNKTNRSLRSNAATRESRRTLFSATSRLSTGINTLE